MFSVSGWFTLLGTASNFAGAVSRNDPVLLFIPLVQHLSEQRQQ
jgi:hypothetical protein